MRTESRIRPALLGIATVVATVALFTIASSLAIGAPPPYPSDLEALGISAEPVSSTGTISEQQAFATAERDGLGMIPKDLVGEAFLVALTDNATLRGDNPISKRAVWLIRYTGFSISVSGPIRADGTAADGGSVSTAYVYIDAVTGEWLLTRLDG